MRVVFVCVILLSLGFSVRARAQGTNPAAAAVGGTGVIPMVDAKAAQLTGHWHFGKGGLSCEWTYKEEGTFFGTATQGGKVVWEYEGKWALDNGVVHYEYTKSSLAGIPVGKKGADTVVEVGKDYYTIVAEDGDRERNERVK